MSGYYGYSMSNNAVEAYENGERPLSKWRKSDILEAISVSEIELKCSISKLQKLPVKVLKEECLTYSSWHHTSNHYNQTNFYTLDEKYIESLTDEKIDKLLAECKSEEREKEPVEERWKCAFLEWSGSRKHPKATELVEEGIVKGQWFFRKDGSKKKTSANGFRFIEKVSV